MKKNKTKRSFSVLCKGLVIVSFIGLIKFITIEISAQNREKGVVFNQEEGTHFSYDVEPIITDEGNFNKPVFTDENLNTFVGEYIEKNACTTLEYSIFELDKKTVNVFLNCGHPDNMIYNHTDKKRIYFDDITKNYDEFIRNFKRLLDLKYPSFVSDDISFEKAKYDIKSNEIVGYYESKEYGLISCKINNNEIKDIMMYEMQYDDAYENEKFALDPNKKTVAFTFDDGPGNYDVDLIDILTKSHASATFYVVGNRLQSYPNSIKKMLDNEMEIGNHTYDHKSLTSLSDEEVKEEITKTNDIFYEMTGEHLTSLRPSYGNINKKISLQVRMPVILWNIDTLDWKTRNPEKISAEILDNVSDGDIVLMHSIYSSTLEAVKKVLPELYKRGFQVTSVEKLAKLKKYNLTSGKTILNIK